MTNIGMDTPGYMRNDRIDAIKRTSLLTNKTRTESIPVLDFLFLSYIDQKIANDAHHHVDVIAAIIEEYSLTSIINRFFLRELEEIIPDKASIIGDDERIRVIKKFTTVFNTYCFEQGINHNFLMIHGINDSPVGYATRVFLIQKLGYSSTALPKNIGWFFFSCRHTFFSSYLPEQLFEKKTETIRKERELQEVLEIQGSTYNALKTIFTQLTDSLDMTDMIQYIQHIYAILIISKYMPIAQEQYRSFSSFIADIQDLSGPKKDHTTIYLNALGNFFPNISPDKEVTCVCVLGTVKIVHKNNFVVTDRAEPFQIEEILLITSILYNEIRSDEMIKNARIYDSRGYEVLCGDFFLKEQWGDVKGTYYILTEHDGFWDVGKALVKDISSTPYHKSFALDPDYIKIIAKFKIQGGRLIKNTFLENNVFCFFDIIT